MWRFVGMCCPQPTGNPVGVDDYGETIRHTCFTGDYVCDDCNEVGVGDPWGEGMAYECDCVTESVVIEVQPAAFGALFGFPASCGCRTPDTLYIPRTSEQYRVAKVNANTMTVKRV